jgi:hypothetical protein
MFHNNSQEGEGSEGSGEFAQDEEEEDKSKRWYFKL